MNGSELKVIFTWQRNPSYLLINAYLPSFCTMFITILPLFLNDRIHFATSIMLVLTSQLCLYTLFQSSLTDMPKTAYLKHIDYWNLFALSVSLTNFFTLFLWEIMPHSDVKHKIKNIMKIAVPSITFIGFVIYWTKAGLIYFR